MNINDLLHRANFPIVSGEYKMAQMMIDGQPFFRFAEYSKKDWINNHSLFWQCWTPNIIEQTARLLDRHFPDMEIQYDEYGTHDIPKPKSEWYNLVGDGYAKINVEGKKIECFHGNSCIYGNGNNQRFIEQIRQIIPNWEFPKG